MTIKPYLRVYTGSDMHYRFDDESGEWYDGGDIRFFDRYDYSDEEEDSDEEDAFPLSIAAASSSWQSTDNSLPKDTGDSLTKQAEEATSKDVETEQDDQTQTEHDLSYYGYGDYDFSQLSRVTTAFNIHDFMDPNPMSAVEDNDKEGDKEEDQDDEGTEGDYEDEEDANRRWPCPEPQR
ncbi:hypothetical protein HMPREF1624_00529 [Sporothrix schenckii ATCC 58251]|uniref:Uncharacterized protein n=1 Tax=Sporothrix schenckii (strain ATCC 58251 / de Perez 2211183) TaxID=1391915 RepID=U7Q677_SPOS1|nr:hypothetical protein HMPREF1624_00529 [Sporothrix schenckii ATCC 58251]